MKDLIGFELKKIMQKKILWITVIIFLILQLINTCGAYFISSRYVDKQFLETNANWYKIERKYAQDLSGRKIDDSLLAEIADTYKYKPNSFEKAHSYEYLSSDDYQNKVRPYEAVDKLVKEMGSIENDDDVRYSNILSITQDMLYKSRKSGVEALWNIYKLSDDEIKYWTAKEKQLPEVFTYKYGGTYTKLVGMGGFYFIFVFMIFILAICFEGIFIDEHLWKTDQLVLCTKNGRKESYIAKMAAGCIVTVCVTLLYLIVTVLAYVGTCGAGDFSASVQVALYPFISETLTIGQVVLIMTGILFLSSIVMCIITMALSEIVNNNVGTMAIIIAFSFFIARLIQIPKDYKFLGKLWSIAFPINILKANEGVFDDGFFDVRLWHIFGMKLTHWQLAPFVYIIVGIIFFFIGKWKYCKYQVSGR